MYRLLTLAALLSAFSSVFAGKISPKVSTQIIRGPTAPLENVPLFDSSVLAKGLELDFLREAELKHGRVAMIASVLLPTLEHFTDGLGINKFQELPDEGQLLVVFGILATEFSSMLRGWENPIDKPFQLKGDYQPGDFGFGLWKKNDTLTETMMDKELNNGRLAMIAALGMIVQELVTQQPLF
jgi:light-harvesting complex I chlorophyll a/b binding protein 4